MDEATRKYILAHRHEDVRQLALSGRNAEVDMPMALQQIAGWQTAQKKLPSWAAVEDILYPPHLNMEQCSSEQTARYKAKVVARNIDISKSHQVFVDLTGGFGIDFSFMSRPFRKRIYVERNMELCEIARHNFQLLGLEAEIVCDNAEEYLARMPHANVVFLDPARRDAHGSRTYGIEDCTPNVIELLPLLKEKADTIILKLSPMLDWRKAVSDLGGVSEVHIVSVDNECKELLLVIRQDLPTAPLMVCVNGDRSLRIVSNVETNSFSHENSQFLPKRLIVSAVETIQRLTLLEPNASIMKAGCFKEIEQMFGIQQLSANSHLFVSEHEIPDFPGRQFRIETVTSMNKQELKAALQGIERANITVRNFPMTVDSLRKKLKVKDGGEMFIFGTTMSDGSHKLLICRKIG